MFIKICGITNEEDALLAVALGADCLGFNFVTGSPRRITPHDAESIVRRLPHGTVTVGVFKNEAPETIVQTVTHCSLSGAQLHGREPISEVRWIRKRLPFVIQAFSADDPHLETASKSPADIILLDAATPGAGRVFDWRLASNMPNVTRLMVAGGLTPENVAEAIAQLKPYGVDVATGVEASPGKKDAKKMQKFIDIVRSAGGDSLISHVEDLKYSQRQRPITQPHSESSTDVTSSVPDNGHLPFYDWNDDGE